MQRIRSYGPSIVLLLTIGAVLAGGPYVMRQLAWAQKDADIQLARAKLEDSGHLKQLSKSFRSVAKAVT